jgi:hypothetical protein
MTTENRNLTNEQCDAILMDAHIESIGLEEASFRIYRRSQYPSFEKAKSCGAVSYISGLYGYATTMDVLYGVENVARLVDFDSTSEDLRVLIRINDEQLPECWLEDGATEIHRHLVRMGCYAYPFPAKT